MKREITYIPKDTNTLQTLLDICGKNTNSWIFLHENVISDLLDSSNDFKTTYPSNGNPFYTLTWLSPNATAFCEAPKFKWGKIKSFFANKQIYMVSNDPEEILFLKIEE